MTAGSEAETPSGAEGIPTCESEGTADAAASEETSKTGKPSPAPREAVPAGIDDDAEAASGAAGAEAAGDSGPASAGAARVGTAETAGGGSPELQPRVMARARSAGKKKRGTLKR